jgi:hypothetical protein
MKKRVNKRLIPSRLSGWEVGRIPKFNGLFTTSSHPLHPTRLASPQKKRIRRLTMPTRIMLIDSDLQALKSLRRELEGEYLVLSSSRGHAAAGLFDLFRPEAVVANHLTEGLDTRDFLEWLRHKPEGFDVPVWLTKTEGAPPSLFAPKLPGVFYLRGSVHPVLLKVQINWHFGHDRDPRPKVFET